MQWYRAKLFHFFDNVSSGIHIPFIGILNQATQGLRFMQWAFGITQWKIIARTHGCVRNDSETHETVLLDCTTGFAICVIALMKLGETFHLKRRDLVTVRRTTLLLCCYHCDCMQQHYDVTQFEYVLWHHTMFEWVMNIHYQTCIAQRLFTNIILTPSKQWGVCDKWLERIRLLKKKINEIHMLQKSTHCSYECPGRPWNCGWVTLTIIQSVLFIWWEYSVCTRVQTVHALPRALFDVYSPCCAATREINTNITLEWARKQFVTRVFSLFHFLHGTMNQYMTMKLRSSHKSALCLTRLVCILLITSQSIAYDVIMARQLWRKHAKSDI